MFTNNQTAASSAAKKSVLRFALIALMIAVLAFSVFAFVACDNDDGGGNSAVEESTISIYVGENAPITCRTDKTNVFDVLVMMKNYGGLTTLTYTTSEEFGAYVTALGDLSASDSDRRSITVYHNIDDVTVKDMSGFMENKTVNGVTFYPSGVGVSFLPVKDGAAYYFTYYVY